MVSNFLEEKVMAKVISETVVVTFSKLVRDDVEGDANLVTDDVVATVDATLQEILEGEDSLVVEVSKG